MPSTVDYAIEERTDNILPKKTLLIALISEMSQ